MFCHCFSYIFVCYHIIKAFTFISFVSFGTHTFGDRALNLFAHVFKLIMNGYYLSSTGNILIRVGLIMHGSPFKNRHFAAKDLLKLNNTINTCLIKLNIILYYSQSLILMNTSVRFVNRILIDLKIIHF